MKNLLTKSRYKLAAECPTKLYYGAHPERYENSKSDDSFLKHLAKGGFQVGALAQLYFPGGHFIETKDKDRALAETEALLRRENVILYEAAFRFEDCFIRADIVVKEANKIRLYEVKSSSFGPGDDFWTKNGKALYSDWEPYLADVAFQHWVIRSRHPEFEVAPYLCLANRAAVSTVDGLNQLFRLTKDGAVFDRTLGPERLGAKLTIEKDVTREVAEIQKPGFEERVRAYAKASVEDAKWRPTITDACKTCEFRSGLRECWNEALALPAGTWETRRTIFEIGGLRAKSFLGDGVYFVDQLTDDDVNDRQRLQLVDKPHFDRDAFLAARPRKSPLHFIDFETTAVAIPFTKGRRPYETIAFQFSHHTIDADGNVRHAGEWISTEPGRFPNFDFVRALKRQLEKDDGPVFRYAAHENTVLNHIREQLLTDRPSDYEALVRWIETLATPTKKHTGEWEPVRPMIDLLAWVKECFWHPRMKGSNSIKVVLPAVLEASSFLREKYRKPISGSTNFPADWVWVREPAPHTIEDPYALLPPVFDGLSRNLLDRLFDEDELADGGAAMMAYSRLQFSEMSDAERADVRSALLRYCELDTLAMVMLYEGWSMMSGTD